MRQNEQMPDGRKAKGGKWIPAFCHIIGTLMILAVAASCLPVTIAHIKGNEVYHVVSGSMEPVIPTGSLVYAEPARPEEIAAGDVIAFWSGRSVVVHRVVENKTDAREFVTKGDANAAEDIRAAAYSDLIGSVSGHIPMLGSLLVLYTSTMGKVCAICFAGCGAMLNILAGRLRGEKESDNP